MWEEIVLSTLIYQEFKIRIKLLKLNMWQEIVLVAILTAIIDLLTEIKLLKEMILIVIFFILIIRTIIRSLWEESKWREIVSIIVISPLLKREVFIEVGSTLIIFNLLFKIKPSLKLKGWEILGLTITSMPLVKMNLWIEIV